MNTDGDKYILTSKNDNRGGRSDKIYLGLKEIINNSAHTRQMVLDVIINKLNLAKSSAQGMLVTLVRLEIINKTEQGFYKWD
jgi:hypothetical protein